MGTIPLISDIDITIQESKDWSIFPLSQHIQTQRKSWHNFTCTETLLLEV